MKKAITLYWFNIFSRIFLIQSLVHFLHSRHQVLEEPSHDSYRFGSVLVLLTSAGRRYQSEKIIGN